MKKPKNQNGTNDKIKMVTDTPSDTTSLSLPVNLEAQQ